MFKVLHVGRPYAPSENIPAEAWKVYSQHETESAAWKKIDQAKAHLSPGSWDDHYKVIDPSGNPCDRQRFAAEQDAERMYKEQRKRK